VLFKRMLLRATIPIVLCAAPTVAFAQAHDLEAQPGQFQVKLSGFGNFNLGDTTADSAGVGSESEIEIGPQYRTQSGIVLAGRAVLNLQANTFAAGSGTAWSFTAPELSVFVIGPFGRIEIGDRAGFPQSLVGFTPSEIAFTAAEFGPDSGFYGDRSAKLIYLTPRSQSGFYGAISYTPRTQRDGGGFSLADGARTPASGLADTVNARSFRNVVQAALVWNHRTEILDLSAGATFSDASATTETVSHLPVAPLRRSDSLSAGVSATLYDTWTVGVSGTYDDFSSRRAAPGAFARPTSPYGVVTSLNYVSGPWIVGGYYQHATADSLDAGAQGAAGTAATLHRDSVDVGQFGVSYQADKNHDLLGVGRYTEVKLYAGAYLYRFRGQDTAEITVDQSGAVFLLGARFSFF
jgi:hypothetical protein